MSMKMYFHNKILTTAKDAPQFIAEWRGWGI